MFTEGGCTACHTIDTVPVARGVIGPDLTHVASVAGQRVAGLSAEEYLRQSIQEPNAFVVEGFAPLMAVPS
ncbi:MAG: cytochrome c oxidase subunit II, partial [Dehalococcoidia bacterium]